MRHDVPLRAARDRLIDLLGIGTTYPLSDLKVVTDQLKVAFGVTARVPIDHAQVGVRYDLCDPHGEPLGEAYRGRGDGGTLEIETPKVTEDVTYRIRASKVGRPARFALLLDEGAPVKVGIDTGLVLRILGGESLLVDDAEPSAPRIVAYGESVEVQVEGSQEGVEYSLIVDGVAGKQSVAGNLGDSTRPDDTPPPITLTTGPVYDDAVIQVHAKKTYRGSRQNEEETLDTTLYLKVRANPALVVSVEASPSIVDHGQGTVIEVAGAQQGVRYRAFVRSIPDRDFVHGDATGSNVLSVTVPGNLPGVSPKRRKPDAQVKAPTPYPDEEWRTWHPSEGYAPAGDGPEVGTGADLRLAVPELTEDVTVIVQAAKEHRIDPEDPDSVVSSSVCLHQAAVVLVRPDPEPALVLRAVGPAGEADGVATLEVSGGQPGVFYYLGKHPLPAYFHQRDDLDGTRNKGVDQLGIEVDFAVAADGPASADPTADPAETPPPAPLLDLTPPTAVGTTLSVIAVKAQTLVELPIPDVKIPKPGG